MSDLDLRLYLDEPCHELALARGAESYRPEANAPGLHFAPDRWLLTAADVDADAQVLERLREAGALLIDGRAKWCRIALTGAGAQAFLSQFLSLPQVLGSRRCAAASLLDCPVVIARADAGFELWLGRSWGPWLHRMLSSFARERAAR